MRKDLSADTTFLHDKSLTAHCESIAADKSGRLLLENKTA